MVELSKNEKLSILNYIGFYVDFISLEEIKQFQSKSFLKKFTIVIDNNLREIQKRRNIFLGFLNGELEINKKDIIFIFNKIDNNIENEVSNVVLSSDDRDSINIFSREFLNLLRKIEKLDDNFTLTLKVTSKEIL